MKTFESGYRRSILALVTVIIPVAWVVAQTVPQPGVVITPSGTNVVITITNSVGWANYELYRRIALDLNPGTLQPAYPWALYQVGTQGQQNFTASMGIYELSFYQVGIGSDWDSDGIANASDAQPSSTNAGLLSITIDFPLNNGKVP